jgi:hypothetical protein
MQLQAAWALGASITDMRIDSPSMSIPARTHIVPGMRSASVPSRPFGTYFFEDPIQVPLQEEVATQVSNNLGAATENEWAIAILTPPYWNNQFKPGVPFSPAGPREVLIKFTATIVVSNLLFSAAAALTLAENLKGGWYALRWGQVQVSLGIAFRWIFPRQRPQARRPYRPGWLCSNALGDTPEEMQWLKRFGDCGYFHSSELPQIEVLAPTGAGTAVTGFMMLAFLGPGDPAMPPPGVM